MPRKKSKVRANGEGSIFKRGNGRWTAYLTVGSTGEGSQKKKWVYGKTQEEVKVKLSELGGRVRAGLYVDKRITAQTYLQEWLEQKTSEGLAHNTVRSYRQRLENHIYPRVGHLELSKLTALHVEAMLREVFKEVSGECANKCKKILSGALKRAVQRGLLAYNVVDRVPGFKAVKPKEFPLWTPEEAQRFLAVISDHRLYGVFYLAMVTGMRHGEVLGLRWKDASDDALHIRQALVQKDGGQQLKEPKTKKGTRIVPIDPHTLGVLERRKKAQKEEKAELGGMWGFMLSPLEGDLIFTTLEGKPLNLRSFDRTWKSLIKQAGVSDIRFHDLRHMYVSLMIERGFDARVLADRVGHEDPSFLMKRYSHSFDKARKAAAVPLSDLLGMALPSPILEAPKTLN